MANFKVPAYDISSLWYTCNRAWGLAGVAVKLCLCPRWWSILALNCLWRLCGGRRPNFSTHIIPVTTLRLLSSYCLRGRGSSVSVGPWRSALLAMHDCITDWLMTAFHGPRHFMLAPVAVKRPTAWHGPHHAMPLALACHKLRSKVHSVVRHL